MTPLVGSDHPPEARLTPPVGDHPLPEAPATPVGGKQQFFDGACGPADRSAGGRWVRGAHTSASLVDLTFNTSGPCVPGEHYMLPPERPLGPVMRLVEERKYLTLHAGRQTGKTTSLQWQVDHGGKKSHLVGC